MLLRRHLLPAKFSPTGDYKERVYTGVVAFRVLCHAEIEEYLENRVLEIAASAHSSSKNGDIALCAACFLSFSERNFGLPPETFQAPHEGQRKDWPERVDIKARVGRSITAFTKYVRTENHGIREKNLLRLLLPVGANFLTFDPLLISELDSFGQQRGAYAHKSVKNHVVSKPDPKEEYNKVKAIVGLLKDVDKELDRIMAAFQ